MSDLKSQLTGNGYLAASLNFMAADTRQGLTSDAARAFETIKTHAGTRPGAAEYVARVEQTLKK